MEPVRVGTLFAGALVIVWSTCCRVLKNAALQWLTPDAISQGFTRSREEHMNSCEVNRISPRGPNDDQCHGRVGVTTVDTEKVASAFVYDGFFYTPQLIR